MARRPGLREGEKDTIPDRENAPKRGKTTVSRRSKDPVNIPSSSGRFRRSVFEGNNNAFVIGIQYRSGWLVTEGDRPVGINYAVDPDRSGRETEDIPL